jgi:hypothetical protein
LEISRCCPASIINFLSSIHLGLILACQSDFLYRSFLQHHHGRNPKRKKGPGPTLLLKSTFQRPKDLLLGLLKFPPRPTSTKLGNKPFTHGTLGNNPHSSHSVCVCVWGGEVSQVSV